MSVIKEDSLVFLFSYDKIKKKRLAGINEVKSYYVTINIIFYF